MSLRSRFSEQSVQKLINGKYTEEADNVNSKRATMVRVGCVEASQGILVRDGFTEKCLADYL